MEKELVKLLNDLGDTNEEWAIWSTRVMRILKCECRKRFIPRICNECRTLEQKTLSSMPKYPAAYLMPIITRLVEQYYKDKVSKVNDIPGSETVIGSGTRTNRESPEGHS